MPTASGDAERLKITFAPLSAMCDEGGTAVQRSSHSSTPNSVPLTSNVRPAPKSAACPATGIVSSEMPAPDANQRFS